MAGLAYRIQARQIGFQVRFEQRIGDGQHEEFLALHQIARLPESNGTIRGKLAAMKHRGNGSGKDGVAPQM